MRKLLVAFLLSLPAFATTPFSVNVQAIAAVRPTQNVTVEFRLQNCTTGQPRVIATNTILAQLVFDFKPNASGLATGVIYGNNEIDCGGSSQSYYTLVYVVNGIPFQPAYSYTILSTNGTFDPSVVNPISSIPVVIPPVGDCTYARLDGGCSGTAQWPYHFAGTWTQNQKFGTGLVIGDGLFLVNCAAFGCVGDGVTDDSTAIQACINFSSTHGVVCYLPGKTYWIASTGLVLKDSTNLMGTAWKNTTIQCAYTVLNCVSIDVGAVQGVHVAFLRIQGDFTNATSHSAVQRGLTIFAQDSGGTGGLFDATFADMQIKDFTGEGIWLRGFNSDSNHPNQYIDFHNVQVNSFRSNSNNRQSNCPLTPEQFDPTHANGLGPCYNIKMTGQDSKITFSGNSEVTGPFPTTFSGTNVFVGYEVSSAETVKPNNIYFPSGFTNQSASTGLQVEFANNVTVDSNDYEQLQYGILVDSGNATVSNTSFKGACSDGAAGGYCIKSNGANGIVAEFSNKISGNSDFDFVAANNGTFSLMSGNSYGNAQNPSGTSLAVSISAGAINTHSTLTAFVNTSATHLSTITSSLSTGEQLTIVAQGGSVLVDCGGGGNIKCGTFPSTVTISQNGVMNLRMFSNGLQILSAPGSPTLINGATVPSSASVLATNSSSQIVAQTGAITVPAVYTATQTTGPYLNFFDDYILGNGWTLGNVGAPVGNTQTFGTTGNEDINTPGDLLLTSGTGGAGTGASTTNAGGQFLINPQSAVVGWFYDTRVLVPVLPGTTAGSYQSGITGTPTASPWTNGIGFYLSSTNGVANDWYCRYSSTSTDSTVAATTSWTKLTIISDATKVHWYINGVEVCGTGVVVGSMPTGILRFAHNVAAQFGTSVTYDIDYVAFQRTLTR